MNLAQDLKTQLESSSSSASPKSLAFLYRMKDRDKIKDRLRVNFRDDSMEYLDTFKISINVRLDDKTPEEAIKEIRTFFEEENKRSDDQSLIYELAGLSKIEDVLIKHLSEVSPKDQKLSEEVLTKLNQITEKQVDSAINDPKITAEINNMSYAAACKTYFGEYFKRQQHEAEDFNTLKSTGKLYCPPGGKHSWKANLEWLLERFKNESEFVIMSLVCEESGLRSSGLVGSGFYNEIATCYKLGYKLERNGKDIILKHPNTNTLKNLTIYKISMSKHEMEQYFNQAIIDFNKINKVETVPGIVKTKVISKKDADALHKQLIRAGVDKLYVTTSYNTSTPDECTVRVKSPIISELELARKIMGISFDPDSELGIKRQVPGSHFMAIEANLKVLPQSFSSSFESASLMDSDVKESDERREMGSILNLQQNLAIINKTATGLRETGTQATNSSQSLTSYT